MVRTIVIPENANLSISIPAEYIGKPIEITCMALDEFETKPGTKKSMSDFWGVLSDVSADDMRKQVTQSRKEWEEREKKQFE